VEPLREAVHLEPGQPIAHNLYGVALDATGRNTEAMRQFRLAVEQKPGFDNAGFNLAPH
jgi:Flp pilus assembly protein TadD